VAVTASVYRNSRGWPFPGTTAYRVAAERIRREGSGLSTDTESDTESISEESATTVGEAVVLPPHTLSFNLSSYLHGQIQDRLIYVYYFFGKVAVTASVYRDSSGWPLMPGTTAYRVAAERNRRVEAGLSTNTESNSEQSVTTVGEAVVLPPHTLSFNLSSYLHGQIQDRLKENGFGYEERRMNQAIFFVEASAKKLKKIVEILSKESKESHYPEEANMLDQALNYSWLPPGFCVGCFHRLYHGSSS